LYNADLRDADLIGSDSSDTDLRGANLENALLQGATFESARLQGADLRVKDASGANFHKANLDGAELAGSFYGVDLSAAQMRGAALGGAYYGADFSSALLDGAKMHAGFQGAILHGTSLWRAEFGSERSNAGRGLPRSSRELVDFREARFDPLTSEDYKKLQDSNLENLIALERFRVLDPAQTPPLFPAAKSDLFTKVLISAPHPPEIASLVGGLAKFEPSGRQCQPVSPESEQDFYGARANFLATLACKNYWAAMGVGSWLRSVRNNYVAWRYQLQMVRSLASPSCEQGWALQALLEEIETRGCVNQIQNVVAKTKQ